MRRLVSFAGYTLLEILLVLSMAATVGAMAVPMVSNTLDHLRTSGAARHMAARVRRSPA